MTGPVGSSAGDLYSTLAEDYHWLVPPGEAKAVSLLARHPDRLSAFGSDAAVLDCACGVGSDAIALARAGYRVSASDGSEAMVAEARRLVDQAGVAVAALVCRWEDLPGCFDQSFDVVLCLGNSISHLPSDAMVRAFQGMGGVTRDRGLLVLNARNWEKLRRERPRLSAPDRVVARDGRRCVPLYIWSYADDWGAAHHVEIVFVLDTAGRVTTRRHELTFWPFRVSDLRERLEAAGFAVVDDTYQADQDWYEVVAEHRR